MWAVLSHKGRKYFDTEQQALNYANSVNFKCLVEHISQAW